MNVLKLQDLWVGKPHLTGLRCPICSVSDEYFTQYIVDQEHCRTLRVVFCGCGFKDSMVRPTDDEHDFF